MRDAHRKLSLQTNPDKAILRLARVLARLAAREDHEGRARRSKRQGREPRSMLDSRPIFRMSVRSKISFHFVKAMPSAKAYALSAPMKIGPVPVALSWDAKVFCRCWTKRGSDALM